MSELDASYILHTRPYRNTSVILDVLTESHGRVSLISRGGRGPKSKIIGLLQPFTPLLLGWLGNSDLMLLTHTEPAGRPIRLQAHNLLAGLYINELLIKLLQRSDHCEKLFLIYKNTLEALINNHNIEIPLRYFECDLLTSLGYELELNNNIVPEKKYYFIPEEGIFSDHHLANKNLEFQGESLISLANRQLQTPEHCYDAKRLLRLALQPLLGHKKLKSRECWQGVKHD